MATESVLSVATESVPVSDSNGIHVYALANFADESILSIATLSVFVVIGT